MELENFEIFGILLELNVIGVIGTLFGLERTFLFLDVCAISLEKYSESAQQLSS